TWSPWIGCTEVSTEASGGGGCDHCYARELDARYQYGGAKHWGAGVPRHRTSESYWRKPLAWNREAGETGKTRRVFPSLCDPFDDEVSDAWRADFFELIEETLGLTWLLLTKRPGNAVKMLPRPWMQAPMHNVWIGATIVNQKEADRDIPKLLVVPAVKRFISYEPALGPVIWPGFNGDTSWCPVCKAIVPDSLAQPHEQKHDFLASFSGPFDPNRHCSSVYDM